MDARLHHSVFLIFVFCVSVLLSAPALAAAPANPSRVDYPTNSSTGAFTVSWPRATATAYYELQERKDGGAWQSLFYTEIGITSVMLSGRTNGSYVYRVRSCDDTCNVGYKLGTNTLIVSLVAPTLSLSASPTTVAYNGSTTATWSSTNATSCTLDGVAVALSGSQVFGNLTTSRTFTLACGNPAGTPTAQAAVTVIPPPVFNSIGASPSLVGKNQTSTIIWATNVTTSCTVDGVAANSPYTTPALSASRVFRIVCSNISGSVTQDVTVNVQPPPVITSFTVLTNPLESGLSTNLTWATNYTSSCTLNGAAVALSGTASTGVLTSSKRFTLSCSGLSGSTSQYVDLNVAPRTVISSFVADVGTIAAGQATNVRWSVANATSCRLDGGSVATSGSVSTGVLQANRNYLLECFGIINSPSQLLTVVVQPSPQINSFTADANPIISGTGTVLRWSSSNAIQCEIDGVTVATSSNFATGNLAASHDYQLRCLGVNGSSAERRLAINVQGAPAATLSAAKLYIEAGTSTDISWTSSNTSACTINGSVVSLSGSQSTGVLNSTQEYRLTCTGAGVTVERMLSITVLPAESVWRDVGQCDPNTGRLMQVCVEGRVCVTGDTRQASGNCQLSADCQE